MHFIACKVLAVAKPNYWWPRNFDELCKRGLGRYDPHSCIFKHTFRKHYSFKLWSAEIMKEQCLLASRKPIHVHYLLIEPFPKHENLNLREVNRHLCCRLSNLRSLQLSEGTISNTICNQHQWPSSLQDLSLVNVAIRYRWISSVISFTPHLTSLLLERCIAVGEYPQHYGGLAPISSLR